MSRCRDKYQEPEIIVSGAAIVRVHRPILDDAERTRRIEQEVKPALAAYGRAAFAAGIDLSRSPAVQEVARCG